MKVLLFALLALTTIGSCKNSNNKHSVVGKWKPTEVNLKEMKDDEKQKLKENLTLEFREGGKFTLTNKDQKVEGTYTIDEKNSKIVLTNDSASSDRNQEFTLGWEDRKMLLTNEEGTVKMVRH